MTFVVQFFSKNLTEFEYMYTNKSIKTNNFFFQDFPLLKDKLNNDT